MTDALVARVGDGLRTPVNEAVRALAERLGREAGAAAVLFYGSNLRTGSLDGVLDFYILTPGGLDRGIWPTVGYHEATVDGTPLRAKVATMSLATFAKAAAGDTLDTTIWTRFVQPAALAWCSDAAAARDVVAAVATAVVTAGRHAAALGPVEGSADEYWRALFQATYAAELRVEARGREESILSYGRAHFAGLLELAWSGDGRAFENTGDVLHPAVSAADRATLLAGWRRRQRLGKPLNIVRLLKAAFTFDGAARYAAWKIERHTGVPVPLTPWRERHPVLAAPGVLWRVWRATSR